MNNFLLWISATLVGISKGGFAGGVGIVAIPLMTIALSPTLMLATLLPLLMCGDIFSLLHYPKKQSWRNIFMLVPGCIVGVGIGALILKSFAFSENGEKILSLLVGWICIIFVLIQLYKQLSISSRQVCRGSIHRTRDNGRHKCRPYNYLQRKFLHKLEKETSPEKPYKPRLWHGVGIGIIAGITSTLAHAAGPLILLFLLPQKLDKRVFVGTALVYFLIGNSVKLIPYISQNIITLQTFLFSLKLTPFVIAGTLLGSWLNKKVSPTVFTYIVYVITFIAGIKLVT